MNRDYNVSSESGSPTFSVDRSGEIKRRSKMNHDRGKLYAPYSNSPPVGFNSSSPGNSSGQESPDFLPFSFSSPNRSYGNDSGSNWKRGRGQRRSFGYNYGHSGFKGKMNYQPNRGNYSSPFRGNRGGKTIRGQVADVSLYYHHSMVEDPWAEFDDKLCISSSNIDSLDVSKVNIPGSPDVSGLDLVVSPLRVNLTCGSHGSDLLESGSDDLSA